MFPIVAETYKFIVGVDTHSRKHVSTIINNMGVVIARREFRVTLNDTNKFIDWALRVASLETSEDILFAIEGTSSYGETLTKALLKRKLGVVEVKPPKTKSRGGNGKTDQIDSELAALNLLRLPANKLLIPRMGEKRKTVKKRSEQGLSQRDIKRSPKRYIARSLYRKLEACNIEVTI